MPVTRSTTRLTRQSSAAAKMRPLDRRAKSSPKRSEKNTRNTASSKAKSSKKKPVKATELAQEDSAGSGNSFQEVSSHARAPFSDGIVPPQAPLPAILSFSLDEAKQHLIDADPRFEDLFAKMKCRPFEHLERVDPFRTLTTSILGQQISWLAARSITHRFIRLFNPSMPEKPPAAGSSSGLDTFFPSAQQVSSLDIATLRTAGLSGRKAEYVQDLAARFADGRLSNEKIFQADDENLHEMLVAVRGIGKWTVDMFAIFSLRRPDILPVGDLGVQRGIVRWFLSLHSPKHSYSVSPRKLPKAPSDTDDDKKIVDKPSTSTDVKTEVEEEARQVRALTPDASSFPPGPFPSTPVTPVRGGKRGTANSDVLDDAELPAPPPAFTPSINRTLNKILPTKYRAPPLPEGLNIKELQSRLEGKKKIKGVLLTPKEMEDLTESWKPYRSLGVYYMWALAEGNKA